MTDCLPDVFCPTWYLKTYPDVAASGMDPLQHYHAHGRSEGRLPRDNRAYWLEAKLWGGFSQWASEGLEVLLVDDVSRSDERAYAAWALAGWLAFQGGSWRRVANLTEQSHAACCPSHLGPVVLQSDALRQEGRSMEARRLLRAAMAQQPNTADLYLAYANACSDGPDLRRLAWINRAFSVGGLAPLELENPDHGLSLDNLAFSQVRSLETLLQPKVSVIMPVFNSCATLATALQSVLQQTWRNIEVLVVDDCSTDGTFELACAVAKRDDRVVVLRHSTNLGVYSARNTGLARASGNFLTTHDSDDWSHPQKLALQAQALLENPVAQASVSNWVRCSGALVFSQWRAGGTWVHCNPSSLMFRHQVVDKLGYWDRVSVGADAEFYHRILAVYGNRAIREVLPGVPLAFGRHRADSLTQRSATHLRSQYYGLRREYQESADEWHGKVRRDGISPLPAMPASRPFPAPEALLRREPAGVVRLVVADFSPGSPQSTRVDACLRHLSELSGQLAVFHLPDVTRPALGQVSGSVRTLMRERGVATVLPGQSVRCSKLYVWIHAGFLLPLDDAPLIEVLEQVLVFTERPAQHERVTLPDWISCAGRVQWCAGGVVQSAEGWAMLDSGLFDLDWYLRRYPDLAEARVAVFRHFMAHGHQEGRDPGPDFSNSGYLARYLGSDADAECPIVMASPSNSLIHYIRQGRDAGYDPLPIFEGAMSASAYRRTVLVCAHLAGPTLFGAELSFLDMLDALNRLGMNVMAALPGLHHAAYFAEVRQRATCVAVLPYGWWKQGVAPCEKTVMHFQRLMRANKVDLVYLNTLVLDEPLLAAKALKLPVIVHVRELPESDSMLCAVLGANAEQIRHRLLANADTLVANSQTVMRYLQGGDDDCAFRPPIHVVPNIVDCTCFDLPFPDRNASFNVGMISSNAPKKGVADFVELARQLFLVSPTIRCLLVGPETVATAALRVQQADGRVPGNVVFCGHAATPQAALAKTHVVVNLSGVQESFGRTVLESMAARRPVVCYNWGALSELVVDGETGFLVPPRDVGAAAERICRLFQSAQLCMQMGEAAKAHAQGRFSPAALNASLGGVVAGFR